MASTAEQSQHAEDMEQYSTSMEDLETIFLFTFQENQNITKIEAPSGCRRISV